MTQVLLIIVGVYLAACYCYGVFTVLRLLTTPTVVRPTSKHEPAELVRQAKAELEKGEFPDEQRIAA